MAVSSVEFDRVRAMLEPALAEAYSDYLVKPAETERNHWYMWPYRHIELHLEETRIWHYGVPVGETGRLQVHVHYPYGNDIRYKPQGHSRLDEKLVKRAVKSARELSDAQGREWHTSLEKQEAYLYAYHAIWDLSEEKRKFLWPVREATYQPQGSWEPLHVAINNFFFESRKMNPSEWDRLFSGEETGPQTPRTWSPRERGYRGNMYDSFFSGAITALDDWSEGKRYY